MADDDLRAFIRDINRRNELVFRGVMAELRELHKASREHSAEIRALNGEIGELSDQIRDMRDETRAQRDGLFRLIDKINELGQGPEPGAASA